MSFNIESNLVNYETLDSLAAMISPDFALDGCQLDSCAQQVPSPQSTGSIGYGSDSSDFYKPKTEPVSYPAEYQSSFSGSPTGSYHSPPPPPPTYYQQEMQVFFPPNFSTPVGYQFQSHDALWNQGLHDYVQSGYDAQPTPISICPVGKAKSALKSRRRASRSKCPCVKCCHARANQIPSPASHACMVSGCNKTYTRPAHLRSHLKSHENDKSPKCEVCLKTVMSADLFMAHMFEHGKEMKL